MNAAGIDCGLNSLQVRHNGNQLYTAEMRADGLKNLPRVLHLRNRFGRDKAAKIDPRKASFDQQEKILGLRFSGNEKWQTLKGIARAFDEADSIRHECKIGLAQ